MIFSRLSIAVTALTVMIVAALTAVVTWSLCSHQPTTVASAENYSIEQCSFQIVDRLKIEKLDSGGLYDLLNYCYTRNFYEAALGEAKIRRDIYGAQTYQNEVMLWMVVIITLSGVALAALQLLASYRLAVLGRETMATSGELTLEHDKLAVKSSVTGLLILSVSLAFFFVYVMFVYTISETAARSAATEADPSPRAPISVKTLAPRTVKREPSEKNQSPSDEMKLLEPKVLGGDE